MTAQIAEILIYEGNDLALCSQPLDDFFSLCGMRLECTAPSSALWRGYIGTWEIIGERLYLIRLEGTLKSGGTFCMESLFPGFPDRAFAHWYSGTLRIPKEKLLKYVHREHASVYESDLFIDIEKGRLITTRTCHNGRAAPSHKPDGEAAAPMAMLRRTLIHALVIQ